MSVVLQTGVMYYRENQSDDWHPLILKADADLSSFIEEYSQRTWELGEYCRYHNVIYRCTTAITTPETWNSSHWTATDVGEELKTVRDTIINAGTSRLVGKKIAIYGDSWAIATYGSLGKAHIETVTGQTVHVVGTSSATMAQIYSSFDSYNADIYIIEGGLNDASLGVGATAFTTAIDNLLSAIRNVNSNAEIYFITPPAIKVAGQYANYIFPLEFYRIGIWSCSPFKNYGVINGLKWVDVKLRSDNVHPTQASEDLIGKHIVRALLNYGDEETHVIEYSKLGRSDSILYCEANGGIISLVANNMLKTATSANTCTFAISTNNIDTIFTTNDVAFINTSTGGAGMFRYSSSSPNSVTLYSLGVSIGGNIATPVVRMPMRVRLWENPYLA